MNATTNETERARMGEEVEFENPVSGGLTEYAHTGEKQGLQGRSRRSLKLAERVYVGKAETLTGRDDKLVISTAAVPEEDDRARVGETAEARGNANETVETRERGITPESRELAEVVRTMMTPVFESLTRIMQNNAEALERLAAAQKVQTDRMEALERQMRLNTPATAQQARHIADAIKRRARELLSKREMEDDSAAVKKLCASIRKALLIRYGVGAVREIPRHEYEVAISLVGTWNDSLEIRDIVQAARRSAGQ